MRRCYSSTVAEMAGKMEALITSFPLATDPKSKQQTLEEIEKKGLGWFVSHDSECAAQYMDLPESVKTGFVRAILKSLEETGNPRGMRRDSLDVLCGICKISPPSELERLGVLEALMKCLPSAEKPNSCIFDDENFYLSGFLIAIERFLDFEDLKTRCLVLGYPEFLQYQLTEEVNREYTGVKIIHQLFNASVRFLRENPNHESAGRIESLVIALTKRCLDDEFMCPYGISMVTWTCKELGNSHMWTLIHRGAISQIFSNLDHYPDVEFKRAMDVLRQYSAPGRMGARVFSEFPDILATILSQLRKQARADLILGTLAESEITRQLSLKIAAIHAEKILKYGQNSGNWAKLMSKIVGHLTAEELTEHMTRPLFFLRVTTAVYHNTDSKCLVYTLNMIEHILKTQRDANDDRWRVASREPGLPSRLAAVMRERGNPYSISAKAGVILCKFYPET